MTHPSRRAVIFDLDGVLTDTAEFHYQGWQRLADEEGIPFDRAANEALRGVSRRDSLLHLLGDHQVDEDTLVEMMERKNRYYVAFLGDMSPDDLLPGAVALVVDAKRRGFLVAIGSSSKNARRVLDGLQVTALFDAVADGHAAERAKPAPDLFLAAAAALDVPPEACVVIEDAGSGVDAALAGGMVAVGIGPEERVGHAHHRFDTVAEVDLDVVVPPAAHRVPNGPLVADGWVVVEDRHDPARAAAVAARHLATDGHLACPATLPEWDPGAADGCSLAGTWDRPTGDRNGRWPVPNGLYARWRHDGEPVGVPPDAGLGHRDVLERRFDVRYGRQWRRLVPAGGAVTELTDERLVAMDRQGVAVQRQQLTAPAGTRLSLATGLVADGAGHGPATGQVHDDALTVRLAGDGLTPPVSTAHTLALAGATVHHERVEQHDRHLVRMLDLEVEDGEVLVTQVMAARLDGDGGGTGEAAALAAARATLAAGYDVLLARHVEAWDRLWGRYDVVVEGDPIGQVALRLALYHEMTATARDPDRAGAPAAVMPPGAADGVADALAAARGGRPDDARDLLVAAATELLAGTDDVAVPGAAAGVWQALVLGLGGARIDDDRVVLAPRLPAGWTRLAFHVTTGSGRVEVAATPDLAEVRADRGNPGMLTVKIHGREVVLAPGDRAGVTADGQLATGAPS